VARNVAMDRASGDIWVFLDDDVILEPEYIQELMRAYLPEVTGVSGIFTNYTIPPLPRRLFETVFVKVHSRTIVSVFIGMPMTSNVTVCSKSSSSQAR